MKFRNDVRICPYCGIEGYVRIVDCQMKEDLPWLYRRRECKQCKQRWGTYEIHCEELKTVRKLSEKLENVCDELGNLLDTYTIATEKAESDSDYNVVARDADESVEDNLKKFGKLLKQNLK